MKAKRFVVSALGAMVLAVSAGAWIRQQVVPFDARKETSSARAAIESRYSRFHQAVEKGDLEPVEDIFNSYFECHNTLGGLRKDLDYDDYADYTVAIEDGESPYFWAGEDVKNSSIQWKVTSFVAGRRFASAFIETTQTCERVVDGKPVKAEIRTKSTDVWQQREVGSKFDWQWEYREVVSLEVRLNGKLTPVEIGGAAAIPSNPIQAPPRFLARAR